jgi:nickel-dependent lactate racemase
MRLDVPYGRSSVPIEVPDEALGGILYPNDVRPGDASDVLARALSTPNGPRTFREFLSDADELLVIVNDRTRSTPTARILDHIRGDIDRIPTSVIVAAGSHVAPTPEELREILGGLHDELRGRTVVHDARRSEDMVRLGVTSRGTEVRLNRRVIEAEKIVAVSSVKPHYFAGFTGGRKSFLPGVASYETIEQNHSHALSPDAQALSLRGNPVHEDMVEAVALLGDKDVFAIQVVLDREHRICCATAGDINDAFEAAVERSREISSVPVERKAGVVVAVAAYPPVDNLYQSQHALEHGKLALEDGGIIILVSRCHGGIGNRAFVDLASSVSSPEEALAKILEGYRLGHHKVARMAQTTTWAQMWAVSDLAPEILSSVFMRPFTSLQEAIDEALRIKGPTSVLFVMDATVTVPRMA